MLVVIAKISVKKRDLDDYLYILKKNVLRVLEEPGCISYSPLMEEIDETTNILNNVYILEKWQDKESLDLHLKSKHMQDYREQVKEMVKDVAITILKEI